MLSGLMLWAQADPGQPGQSLGSIVLMFSTLAIFFYLFIIRPNQKQERERQAKLAAIKKGDSVVTIGGFIGVVHSVGADEITLRADGGNTLLRFQKRAVSHLVADTPADKPAGGKG